MPQPMSPRRPLAKRLAIALAALLALLLAITLVAWQRYGEAAAVLQNLVVAQGTELPVGVVRHDLTVDAASVVHAHVYEPANPAAVLLLVPGLTPAGREDRRVVEVSGVLASAGFRVVAPDLPGAIRLAAGEDDVAVLGALLDHLTAAKACDGLPLGVVAISYGLGPALAAAAEPTRARAIDLIVGLGGYHDGRAIVRYATTGTFVDPRNGAVLSGSPDRRARWLLLYATLDHIESASDRARLRELARSGLSPTPPGLVETTQAMAQSGEAARGLLALVANTDPARVDALLDAIPEGARDALVSLSPSARSLGALEGRLLLVHGEADPVIPYSESLRLAEAVPGSRVMLVPGFSHVEPAETGWAGRFAMIRAVRALLELRDQLPGDPACGTTPP